MDELRKLEDLVRVILREYPDTRNSDNLLYVYVIGYYNEEALKVPLSEYLMYFSDLKIPRAESVARVRRKLQEDNPELRATESVRKWRKDNERKFEFYAKENRG